jgi:hypothetical protein
MATAQKEAFQTAQSTFDDAKSMASDAANKAKDTASSFAQKAGDAASFVGKKADEASSAVGSGMKSLAGTIRDNAPDKGPLGSASSAAANTLESGGRYLEEHGLSGIAGDIATMIKRNPIPAILVGIGLGYLVARATTRSE